MSTQPNPHEPLITSLATFYNLLASLRYIPSDAIIHPPPGGHTNVDTEAVHEAGFDDDAIGVMRLLPYLAEDVKDHVISEETRPRSYINTDDMEAPRNPALADEEFPGYALTLTSTNIDGYALIYDTRTCGYSCCFLWRFCLYGIKLLLWIMVCLCLFSHMLLPARFLYAHFETRGFNSSSLAMPGR